MSPAFQSFVVIHVVSLSGGLVCDNDSSTLLLLLLNV